MSHWTPRDTLALTLRMHDRARVVQMSGKSTTFECCNCGWTETVMADYMPLEYWRTLHQANEVLASGWVPTNGMIS